MRLKPVFVVALLSLAMPVGLIPPARAADLSYLPPAPPVAAEEPTELGAGWYLRGDASVGPEDHPVLQGQGVAARFSTNSDRVGYGLGLGAGYKVNSFLRFDITADYLDPYKYNTNALCGPTCSESYKTNVWRWDGLANGYVDLGTWFGVTPYIGAGAGFSGTHQNSTIVLNGQNLSGAFIDPATGASVTSSDLASHTKYQFAWAGMAGLSYAFTPNMLVDVGYRYLDLGKTTVPLVPITSSSKEVTSHQVRIGIRYVID